jgi:hypothetical protein
MKFYLKAMFSVVILIIFGLLAVGSAGFYPDEKLQEYYNSSGVLTQHWRQELFGAYGNYYTLSGKTDSEGRWHGIIIKDGLTQDHISSYRSECEYSHGKRNGICHYYDKQGKRISSETYIDDKLKLTTNNLQSKMSINNAINDNLIYQQIEAHQPWFNFWMSASDFEEASEKLKSFFTEIELYINTASPSNRDELYTALNDALDSINESGNYQDMLSSHKLLVLIELAVTAKSQPLRLAILNRYRNGLQPSTYQTLETEYPDYLSLLNQYGATTEDIKRVADAFDARLEQLGFLDSSALEFTLQVDERINSILTQMREENFDFGTVQSALLADYANWVQAVDPLYQGAIRAYFSENEIVNLSASFNGEGRLTSNDGRIQCPGICSMAYTTGTSISLTATPDTGWQFAGWGGACSGTGSCTVSLTQHQNVTATFTNDDQDGAADYYRKVNAYFYGTFGRSATSGELAEWGAVLRDNRGSVWKPKGEGLQHYLSNTMGWDAVPLERDKATSLVEEVFSNLFGSSDGIDPRLTDYYIEALFTGSVRPRGFINAVLNDLSIMPRVDGSYGQPNGWAGGPGTGLLTGEQLARYREHIEKID